MTREEREANPEESFDGGYHLYAKEKHKERVAKNSDRIAYAIKQFELNNIEFTLKMSKAGIFIVEENLMINCFSFGLEQGKFLDMTVCVGFIPLSNYC